MVGRRRKPGNTLQVHLNEAVPTSSRAFIPPRRFSAIPIRNPTTGQPVEVTGFSASDWPALPLEARPSSTSATGVNTPFNPQEILARPNAAQQNAGQLDSTDSTGHASQTTTDQAKSSISNGASAGRNAPDNVVRARREVREAIEAGLHLKGNPEKDVVAQDHEFQASFNIFARPYVPRAITTINNLPGHVLDTAPQKTFQYDEYKSASFGPAKEYLSRAPDPNLRADLSTPPGFNAVDVTTRHYETFFQRHLRLEAEAQEKEIEACSLFEHEVEIKPLSVVPAAPGHVICTLHVPGLRENSPLVEEDDLVELRQLVYEEGTSMLQGMSEWLHLKDVFDRNRLQHEPWQDHAPGWTNCIYRARVVGVIRATETLHLRVWGLPLDLSKPVNKFNVRFWLPVERNLPMMYAVAYAQSTISHGQWMNSMLFPTNSDSEIQETLHPGVWNHKFVDRNLNWEQKKAVESALLRTHGVLPFLISGPPGTGKTKTIIEIAIQLVRSSTTLNHILLCAPSDPAADTLCQRLTPHLGPAEMLRLNRPCRTFAEVPGALLPWTCIQGNAFSLPPLEALLKFRVIVTTCRDSAMLERARLTNTDICAVQRSIRELSATLTPYEKLPEIKLHWGGLLLDEAAQAMEPEALIPLSIVAPPIESDYNSSAPVVVMAGDEYQLGPRTVLSASRLKESLFARLFKRSVYANHPLARGKKGEAPPPLTKALLPVLRPAFANLVRNYRSHGAILTVPSNLFYWDTLEPEAQGTDRLAEWTGWQGRRWPVMFHDNQSLDDLEVPGMLKGAGGWHNLGEAAIACRYAQSLAESGLVAQSEICIMSPFRSQVRKLRETMRQQEYGAMWDVNIGPTEAFQGLEHGVVIICVTRARQRFVAEDQKLGWGIIGTPNKMNVALTRAKYGLIVIGNRDLLMEDPNWKAFVRFCDRNGLVAPSDAMNGVNGHGGAPVQEETLTRLEKVMRDRESSRRMPEGPVLGPMNRPHASDEMTLPDANDQGVYNDMDYYDDFAHNGY